jgi:RHS repeat-associated protein
VWGLFANGAVANPYTAGGSSCPPPGGGWTDRCVLLSWPFAGNAWNKARGGGLIYSWHGSIIATKRDGSGLHYMRNRVYDPGTGRFTQEDPIGLAGGLNTYGFANGDPRNSSDPFGLVCCTAEESARILAAIGRMAPAIEKAITIATVVAAAPAVLAAATESGPAYLATRVRFPAVGAGGAIAAQQAIATFDRALPQVGQILNVGVDVSMKFFQTGLTQGGSNVVREGLGKNGLFRVFESGTRAYTTYTATSTGRGSVEVFESGVSMVKYRLTKP